MSSGTVVVVGNGLVTSGGPLRRFARNVLREQDVFARQVDGVHGGLEGKRRKKGRRGERERGRMEMEGRGVGGMGGVIWRGGARGASGEVHALRGRAIRIGRGYVGGVGRAGGGHTSGVGARIVGCSSSSENSVAASSL